MGVVIIKGLIPTNVKQGPLPDRKIFSLTSTHHKCRETKRIVKEVKSYFYPLPRNQSAPEKRLTMEKGMYYLSIICENHIFQDPIGFL